MKGLMQQTQGVAGQASESEQQEYEQAFDYLQRLVTAEPAYMAYAKQLKSASDLIDGVAVVSAQILIRIEQKLGVSDAVRAELVGDIIGEVLEIAEEIGLVSEGDVTEALMKQVVAKGAEHYAQLRQETGTPLDPEQAKRETLASLQEMPDGINAMSNEEAGQAQRLIAMLNGGM